MGKKRDALSFFKLDGKKAVVTGAGRGLGKELAIGLAEAGADVALVDKLKKEAYSGCKQIEAMGRNAIAIEADVSKEEDVKAAVNTIKKEFVEINILVCNAGIVSWSPAEEMSLEDWQKVIDVNLTGVFLFCKWIAKEMKKQGGGSIINISSMSANIVNVPQKQCHYNASKAGVSHLTKSLAVEWAPYNIRVNAICPGYIMTPLLKLAEKKYIDEWTSYTPQKRIPDPSEFKGLCIFLASSASSYVTGSAIVADGGYSLW